MSNPVSLAPDDVAEALRKEAEDENLKKIVLAEKANKVEEERKLLQKYVYNSANPSPVLIAVIVLVTIVVIYIIYMLFIKPSLSGEWTDISGNIRVISHNVMTGKLNVDCNGNTYQGKVSDNFVEMENLVGVWNYGNTIIFIDGPTLERIL
jgi:hypothetical protein